ncbi:uncharacterized protein LOC102714599 [Oryza brachyantha]|uniref:uncharacterized protein LOC102714599 n=1 Tax=Oryza brachyantha TaxID=4533 RepID=UPI001ADD41D5|nr:uncharacterized protein LOC102714599 [Oryza brachyantha]
MDGGGGYSPRFQRQASCSCAPSISMSRRYVRGGFDLAGDGDDDDEYDYDYLGGAGAFDKSDRYGAGAGASDASRGARAPPASASAGRGCGTRLRGLWRRIMRENKKRILLCATGCVPASAAAAAAARVPYDAYSYAQNFDDGAAWVEPENLSRSFSARFAVPSRVLQRVAV